jgi:signal transduction histidine kinase
MEPILQDWEDFAQSLGMTTQSMDTAALRDHAKQILRAVATDLETRQTDAQQEAKSKGDAPEPPPNAPETPAESHGSVRAEEGFSLQEMVSEFRALRASVLRLWSRDETNATPDSYQQLMRFNEAIDEALADSIQTYSTALDQMFAARARERMVALGTLTAGLGHDMANVLLPMRGSLDELATHCADPSAAPLVESLRRSVEHIRGLTRGLRSLSVDPDDPAASPETTVLNEWWANAISPFTWALPHGVRLHAEGFDPAAPLPAVAVPGHVLMQAVFNLVQNAADALAEQAARTARGKVAGNIWVTAQPTTDGGVALTVRDDGPGMDAGTIARCTDPFFSTKPRDRGTGLGLALVRTAVERQGGQLLVQSKLGEGSAFTLILPTALAHDAEPPPPPRTRQ